MTEEFSIRSPRYDTSTSPASQQTCAIGDTRLSTSTHGIEHSSMAQTIDVAPEGWWALAAADSFFPEDLPADWRLTYYANTFNAVLIPASYWTAVPARTLADWRADVHPGFRFYLERPGQTRQHQLDRAADALGDSLAAFVAMPPASDPEAAAALLDPKTPSEQRRIGSALRCPSALNGDLRGARDWLLARIAVAPGDPWFLILRQPTAQELQGWRDLLVLMGLT